MLLLVPRINALFVSGKFFFVIRDMAAISMGRSVALALAPAATVGRAPS